MVKGGHFDNYLSPQKPVNQVFVFLCETLNLLLKVYVNISKY